MKSLIGYTLFWLGLGMLVAILLPYEFFDIVLCALLMIIGYNLFCS